jgi:acetamidase/formamidase
MPNSCNHTIHKAHSHYGWDNAFAPQLTIAPGETVEFETVDASGGQLGPESSLEDVVNLDFGKINPVTGPVLVDGAEPGDALKVTLLGFEPSGWGWTANIPGFGLLADQFPDPALNLWAYDAAALTPAAYGPGGRVPLKPFCGTIGVAPGEAGLHSIVPPRRVGGNMDIRDISAGTELYLPVEVPGALFSVGDCHAAQGDGEVCGTAIESPIVPPVHHGGASEPSLRRKRLRGHHRHRARPLRRRARGALGHDRPADRPSRPGSGRGVHAVQRGRGPAHQRDRRSAELGWVVSVYFPRLVFE